MKKEYVFPEWMFPAEYEEFLNYVKKELNGNCTSMVFNMSRVKFFDIACILQFICLLSELRQNGWEFVLKLPADADGKKTRDFLRRWRFFDALEENVGDLKYLIPPEDQQYLQEEPSFYLRTTKYDERGIIQQVLSKDIVEITSFTKQEKNVQTVNEAMIEGQVSRFESDKSVGEIISKALGLSFGKATSSNSARASYEVFYKTFVYESLINTKHHPKATISLMAVSVVPRRTHLVVAVADNGECIPDTISRAYRNHARHESSQDYTLHLFPEPKRVKMEFAGKISESAKADAKKIFFACLPWVTSRKPWEPNLGMGLTYLVRDTVRLGGEIRIRSGKATVSFVKKRGKTGCTASQATEWRGTLVRIQLPIVSKGE